MTVMLMLMMMMVMMWKFRGNLSCCGYESEDVASPSTGEAALSAQYIILSLGGVGNVGLYLACRLG